MTLIRLLRAGLAALVPLAASAASLEVQLRPQVTLQGGGVTLGDVAYLRSDDLDALRRFMALPLGQAPRAGTVAVVSRDTLARWVDARLRHAGIRVAWQGADEVAIRSMSQQLPGYRVEQTARAALAGWLKERASRFTLEVPVAPRELSIPPGQAQLRARPLPAGDAVASRQRVWVDVLVDGEFVRAVPVDFSVEAYGEAWVAPHGFSRGVPVAAESLERREVRITAGGRKPLSIEPAPSAELRSRRAIAAGEVVAGSDVEPLPAVARGEQVTVLASGGGIELETRAQALQDGQVGQTVQVRTAGAAALLAAQVVSPGRVRVQP